MKTLLASLLAGSALSASAQLQYSVSLSGANERPTPNSSTATGSGTLTLTGSDLSYSISYSGLSGDGLSGSHIHGPADSTASAGVLFSLNGGSPGSTSGTLSGSIIGLTGQQMSDLMNQLWYVNIHSGGVGGFGGGEIRGQITPVPEPASISLLLLGGGAALFFARRQGR